MNHYSVKFLLTTFAIVSNVCMLRWSDALQLSSSSVNKKKNNMNIICRQKFLSSFLPVTALVTNTLTTKPRICLADDPAAAAAAQQEKQAVQVLAIGEIKKLFNEGRAFEQQGNIAAAQRIYGKITKLAPRVSGNIHHVIVVGRHHLCLWLWLVVVTFFLFFLNGLASHSLGFLF